MNNSEFTDLPSEREIQGYGLRDAGRISADETPELRPFPASQAATPPGRSGSGFPDLNGA